MKSFQILIFALVFLACSSLTAPTNPSFALNLTESGIANIKTHVLPIIVSKIMALPLPEIKEKLSFLLTVTVSNLAIKQLDLQPNDLSIDLVDGAILIGLNNVGLTIIGQIKAETLISSNTGALNVVLSGINIGMKTAFALNAEERFTVTISDVQTNIANFDFTIDDSIILKLISDLISDDMIKSKIQDQIQQVLNNQAPQFINDFLAKVPYDFKLPIPPIVPLSLNIKPVSAPLINNNSIELGLYGYIYNYYFNNTGPEIPGPAPFTLNSTDKQIQIIISQYIVESVFYSLVDADVLSYVFIDIPGTNYTVTTNYLEVFLPGVVEKYGDNTMVIFFCRLPVAPQLDFMHPLYDISLDVNVTCEINPVIHYRPTTIGILTFNVSVSADANIINNQLNLNFTEALCHNLDIINTNFSKNNLNNLQNSINLLLEIGIETAVEPTFELPEIQGIKFNDTSLKFGDGFAAIETSPDFSQWDPPMESFVRFYDGFTWVNFLMHDEEVYPSFLKS